jgi:peptide/nickel transport system permease protein
MNKTPDYIQDSINQASGHLKGGNYEKAGKILAKLLRKHPELVEGWVLLSHAVTESDQQIYCLERALRISPHHSYANSRLKKLKSLPMTNEQFLHKTPPFIEPLESSSKTVIQEQPHPVLAEQTVDITAPQSKPDEVISLKKPQFSPTRINWPLIFGSMIIILIALLAFLGPDIAPRDPLEKNTVININDQWYTPPIPFFTPGFPLGSDRFGRDILSRLLYALRPTMTMVAAVAAVRLFMGTAIGLVAGWSTRWIGRLLDSVISGALAVPVLIVSLGGIAAVGVELGVIAFIVGLSITGWVETARIVREQTELIRNQPYIEAARALGSSSLVIIFRHILRQIYTIIWTLFAFEVSSTLMLTSALGFLGYYIGGDVWVQVTDSVAEAISGMPELGQMLATSRVLITRPWGLIAVGSTVFITVLGFNLLGEGLRRQRSLQIGKRKTYLNQITSHLTLWIDHYFLWPIGNILKTRAFQSIMLVAGFIGAVFGGYGLWRNFIYVPEPVSASLPYTGDNIWFTSEHDSFGTFWSPIKGPSNPDVEWEFDDSSGFSGGPVVGKKGVIYITANKGILYALTPAGDLLWQADLPALPVGSPSLGIEGTIYVVDINGGIVSFNPEGQKEWYYTPDIHNTALSGPTISPDGVIYYSTVGNVQAVQSNGDLLWHSTLSVIRTTGSINLGPNGDYLFQESIALDISNGDIFDYEGQSDVDQVMTGADGKLYLRNQHNITNVEITEAGLIRGETLTWEYEKYSLVPPTYAGVTPHHRMWLFYGSYGQNLAFASDTRIVWLDNQGNLISNINYPTRNSILIGIDQNDTIYTCGNIDRGYGIPECQAFQQESNEAYWTWGVDRGSEVNGGAIVSGRLYVSTTDGYLYAIGIAEDVVPIEIASLPTAIEVEELPTSTMPPAETWSPEVAVLFEDQSGFTSAPVIDENSSVIFSSGNNKLLAINEFGELLWETPLDSPTHHDIALSPEGSIYVVHEDASLSLFDSLGEMIWRYTNEDEWTLALSGPVIGQDGNIYYTVERSGSGFVQAVSSSGSALWLTKVSSFKFRHPPMVSPSGEFVLFDRDIILSEDGTILDYKLDFAVDRFITGDDRRTYIQADGTIVEARIDRSGIDIQDERVVSSRLAEDQTGNYSIGITRGRVVWISYYNGIEWFHPNGEAIGAAQANNTGRAFIVSMDEENLSYLCGPIPPYYFQVSPRPYCFAIGPDSDGPLWYVNLSEEHQTVVGAILSSGNLYITSSEGRLFKINSLQTEGDNN